MRDTERRVLIAGASLPRPTDEEVKCSESIERPRVPAALLAAMLAAPIGAIPYQLRRLVRRGRLNGAQPCPGCGRTISANKQTCYACSQARPAILPDE